MRDTHGRPDAAGQPASAAAGCEESFCGRVDEEDGGTASHHARCCRRAEGGGSWQMETNLPTAIEG